MDGLSFDDLIPSAAPATPNNQDSGGGMPDLGGLEQKYNLPAGLLSSVMHQESGGDPNAVSDAGAQGLFQFEPKTAKQYGIDPFDPNQAADGAARMYADLSKKYNGDVPSMLAAYNWGQGNVDHKGLANAPKETRDYINNVMGGMQPKTITKLESYEPASENFIASEPSKDISFDDLIPQNKQTNDISFNDLIPQSSSLSGDIDKDVGSRYAELQRGIHSGELTPLQSGLHGTAQLVGMGTDVAGDLIKRLPGYETARNAVNSAAQSAADYLDTKPAAQAIGDTGMQAESAVSEWAKNHPYTVRAAGDITGIVGGVYGASPVVEGSAKLLGSMGEKSGISTSAALAGIPNIIPASAPAVSAVDIRNIASQSYKTAEAQGGVLSPKVTNSFIDKAQEVLPQTDAGKIVLGETPTTKLVDNLEGLRGKPLTLAEAQEVDSALGDKMTSEVDLKTGKLNAEGNKLLQIQQNLRDSIESAGEDDVSGGKAGFDSWDQGRKLWSASLRMNDIQRILDRASMMDNPVTGIKTGFRTLASNPARLRGFTPQEIGLIKNAAKTGIVTDALRWGGSRLISSMTGMVAGVASGAGELGAVAGSALGYGAGMPLRSAANALQRGRANAVLNAIVNRPAVQAALKPAEVGVSVPKPPLYLPAPKPYSINQRGVVDTGGPQDGIIERNTKAVEPPLSDWPKQTLLPSATSAEAAQKSIPNNALVPHMEGVVSELENSQSGHRFFDFSPESQGSTPNVIGVKSDSPSWFQEYNKNNPPISKKYVRDTFEKMKSGLPLGVRQQKVAGIIRSEGMARYEEDAAQRSAAIDAAKFNPDDANHEAAVMHDDVPFAKGGMVKKFAQGGLINSNPSDAQKEAGNYKKHHIRLHGMDIAIENPKGSVRSGKDKTGKEWAVKMPAHYGYFKGTIGKDGDAVDVYVGDKPDSGRVYVVNQVHDHNGQFDEHKAMLGFPNRLEAMQAYKSAFSDGKGSMRIGSVKAMSVQELRDWLKNGDLKKRAA